MVDSRTAPVKQAPSPSVEQAAFQPWLRAFWPRPLGIDRTERLRIVAGALAGILATALISHWLGGPGHLGWIVAPMGASAVLVFGVPSSPLAQPWSVVAGNTVSALAGIACASWISSADVAAAGAVALAIALMLALRCLHPPGGACALLMAVTGTTDWHAALFPVLANSVLLAVAGMAYNNLTRRSYPHVHTPAQPAGATQEDLDAVLARYNQILDIDPDDLRALVDRAQLHAHQRHLADTRCGDLLTREIATVTADMPLQEAWGLLRTQDVKTLPVVDRQRRLVGIVTLSDFLRSTALDVHPGYGRRLLDAVLAPAHGPQRVGEIMTRKVRVTREHRSLADLVLLFGDTRHRQVPVVGEDGALLGVITQTDVVGALRDVELAEAAEPSGDLR